MDRYLKEKRDNLDKKIKSLKEDMDSFLRKGLETKTRTPHILNKLAQGLSVILKEDVSFVTHKNKKEADVYVFKIGDSYVDKLYEFVLYKTEVNTKKGGSNEKKKK